VRVSTGDPRPAVAERYPTFEAYDAKVITAMNTMIQDRLLLCEDGPSELLRLRQAGVARGVPNPPASFPPYSFPLANISSVTPSQSTLSPADGRMVPVSIAVNVPSSCSVACSIASVKGTGGTTAADYRVTGPLSIDLRAAKTGNNSSGRQYIVRLACTDAASNLSTKLVTVNVP
jgi:hypothetical protein